MSSPPSPFRHASPTASRTMKRSPGGNQHHAGHKKTEPRRAPSWLCAIRRRSPDCGSGQSDACAQQTDAVELGLFAGALFGALTSLVAFVEHLDLLRVLERVG